MNSGNKKEPPTVPPRPKRQQTYMFNDASLNLSSHLMFFYLVLHLQFHLEFPGHLKFHLKFHLELRVDLFQFHLHLHLHLYFLRIHLQDMDTNQCICLMMIFESVVAPNVVLFASRSSSLPTGQGGSQEPGHSSRNPFQAGSPSPSPQTYMFNDNL